MSEYWKSTPKYWCKFCSTYVRDTKLEKQQHEATPRHKGQVQRALRGIHRDHEREEREKKKAKSEVERLNGLVRQSSPSEQPPKAIKKTAAPPLAPVSTQVNPQERKKQLAQLADLGVAIPKEFRGEMAMAGDWETLPQARKRDHDEDKTGVGLSYGVRKRKYEGQEEEEEAGGSVAKKGWGQTFKEYPDIGRAGEDLESLLAGSGDEIKTKGADQSSSGVKKEELEENLDSKVENNISEHKSPNIKDEADGVSVQVVFKKRKPKAARV